MSVYGLGWKRGDTSNIHRQRDADSADDLARSHMGCAVLTALLAFSGAVLVVWYAADQLQ